MSASRVQTLRTSVSGKVPAVGTEEPGVLFVNFADLKIGVIDAGKQGQWLTGLPNFSPDAKYKQGDLVIHGTHILRANTGVSPAAFDQRQWTPIDSDITYGPTYPVNPQAGDLWYDTGATPSPQLKIWDGAAGTPSWQIIHKDNAVAAAAPAKPKKGDIWFDTTKGRLFVWDSTRWIDASPGQSNALTQTQADALYYPRAQADAKFIDQPSGDGRYLKMAPTSTAANTITIQNPGAPGLTITPAAGQTANQLMMKGLSVNNVGDLKARAISVNGPLFKTLLTGQGILEVWSTGTKIVNNSFARFISSKDRWLFLDDGSFQLRDTAQSETHIRMGWDARTATAELRLARAGSIMYSLRTGAGGVSDGVDLLRNGTRIGSFAANGRYAPVSSAAFKTNVAEVSDGLSAVQNLRPVKYDIFGQRSVGFIAEEVIDAVPEAGIRNENGDVFSYDEQVIVSFLVKSVQELTTRLEAVEAKV